MNKICKYTKTEELKDIHANKFINYYVIDESYHDKALYIYFKTNGSSYIYSDCMIVHNEPNTDYRKFGYEKVDFANIVEMLSDIQNLNQKFYHLSKSEVLVACKGIYDAPSILIKVNELYIIYTPKIKDFNVRHRFKIEPLLGKTLSYFNKYQNVVDAFNDPIFKSYVDVLNEI